MVTQASALPPRRHLANIDKGLLSHNFIDTPSRKVVSLLLLAAALDLAAGVGLAYVAGFGAVRHWLAGFTPVWMVAIAGGLAVSWLGYYFAYRETYRAENGSCLDRRQLRAVVTAGFGGFFAHGGAGMDRYCLEEAGLDPREATVRAGVLAGLEHGALGLVGTVAGLVALLTARPVPPLSFQLPWVVLPVPGFALGFWLAARYRDRLRERGGFAGKIAVALDTVQMIRNMFWHPAKHGGGPLGMVVFWVGELGATWAALAAFGVRMNLSSFAIGFLTGAVFTRRTGPFAGAGILMLCLPVTIWIGGAPLGAAVAAVYVARFLFFWLPLPFALATLPRIRAIGRDRDAQEAPDRVDALGAIGEPALVTPAG